jgi:4-amino-4-deoxy-L-arabinose transferase-like glycosyltransferase
MEAQPSMHVQDRSPLAPFVYLLAAFAVLVHFFFNRQYGYFRDELYYAACGEHLDWGYVDHAPLIAFASAFTRGLFGDSLFALRLLPALSAAPKVFLAGWMAREMGGTKFAQFFAALLTLLAPIYLTFDNFFSMNAFEPVFWMLCAAIVLRIANGGSPRLWLLFGVVAGIGILNKHSMLFFGSGILVGLLLTPARQYVATTEVSSLGQVGFLVIPARRQLACVEIWLGAAIAFLVFLPNLLWEIHNGYPTIALLNHVIGGKYTTVSPLTFIGQQFLLVNPLAAPIWLAGLWFLLTDKTGLKRTVTISQHSVPYIRLPQLGRYTVLGIAYLVVLLEMIVLHGKIYYLAPAYIMLLSAGAIWWERHVFSRAAAWIKPALLTLLIISAIVAAPLAMPVLPVAAAVKYTKFFGVQDVKVENVPLDSLPQLFGDMFGWPEQVQAMSRAYHSLPPDRQSRAALLAYNYGEAGAIDYLGKHFGLPKAICGHNQYGYWGSRGATGDIVIAIGFPKSRLDLSFADVQPFATISPPYALPEESNLTIYICRQPHQPLSASWQQWMYLD